MPSARATLVHSAARDIPYFTPAQDPPAGTAADPQPDGRVIPKLFQPLSIRSITFQNRIWVPPMCQYSCKDGVPTAWHLAHLGGILKRGPALVIAEASAVSPEGRITPEDAGIWNDEQAAAWSQVTTFAHSQNQKIGIQLAHAGRKASMAAPWLVARSTAVGEEEGGWPNDIVGPSGIAHGPGYHNPMALTKDGIERVKEAFVEAAKRAVKAGFDVIELHSAHGYLLHEFLSPIANKRTDGYGGSFENRTRLHVEIVDAVRAVIPQDMPLFMRISGSDLLENVFPDEESWTVEDSARLSLLVAEHGVDLMDISAGGIHPAQELPLAPKDGQHTAYQSHLSARIREAVQGKILVAAVGGITDGRLAEEVLQNGWADAVFVGRYSVINTSAVMKFAEDLGVVISQPIQAEWWRSGRGVGRRRPQAATS